LEFIDKSFLKTRNNLEMVFCSDGGVKENRAGFGMVGSYEEKIVVRCHKHLHNIYNNYSSHRSEAWGLLGIFCLIGLIYEYRTKQQITSVMGLQLLCDNKALAKTLNKLKNQTPSIKDYKSADFDLIETIRIKWKQLRTDGIKIRIKHILGHQDKNKQKLSENAKLNVEADILATIALHHKPTINRFNELLDASMHINNLLVTHDYRKIMRQNHLSVDLRNYLRESNNWSIYGGST
jgi:hypothetical protein